MQHLKSEIQKILGKEISVLNLKASGFVSNAYYIETVDGSKYIAKQKQKDKENFAQNTLTTEARVIKLLGEMHLLLPIPRIISILEESEMYVYEYIEGEVLRSVWDTLSEEEKINICSSLGNFHAEIGKKFTKEMSVVSGIRINESTGLHPEVLEEYIKYSVDLAVPEDLRMLLKKAKEVFDTTEDQVVFQFVHNDAHHENVLIKDKKISGIIDFGDAEWGEVAKEFSRYIRDWPDHFHHIVSAYEKSSGHKLSFERLMSNAFLSGFGEIWEDYHKRGEEKERAEYLISKYKTFLSDEALIL